MSQLRNQVKNGSKQTLVTNKRDGLLTRQWGNLRSFRIQSTLTAASDLASKLWRTMMLGILIGRNTWSCVWSYCIPTPSMSSYLFPTCCDPPLELKQRWTRRRSPVQTRGRHDEGCVRCGGHGGKVQCGLGDHVEEVVDGASNLERLRGGGIEIRLKEARDNDKIMILCSSLIGSICQSLTTY